MDWTKEKTKLDGNTSFCSYGAGAAIGWRTEMEDEVTVIQDWWSDSNGETCCFVGVYDGHDNSSVSRFCAKYMHVELLKSVKKGEVSVEQCLKDTFMRMDRLMRTTKGQEELLRLRKLARLSDDNAACNVNWDTVDITHTVEQQDLELGGSTALVGLVFKDRVVVANAGDCRCLVSRRGVAEEVSKEHKPDMEAERERIVAAGGDVYRGRVRGIYSVSRGLGDFIFKANADLPPEKQMIAASPDVYELKGLQNDDFLVFASDGVWPRSQDVVNFVRAELDLYGNSVELSDVCFDFMESYISCAPSADAQRDENGTTLVLNESSHRDNMSMVLIYF